MKRKPIKIVLANKEIILVTDWFALADYIKQENLAGRDVTIHHWEYVGESNV